MSRVKSFKEFIKESIWSDIQDRSSGEITRKEDDINHMGVDDFWLYIIDNYEDRVYHLDKDHFWRDYEMDIAVVPSKYIDIYGSYVKDELVRIMVVLKTKETNETVKKIIDTSPDNFRWIRIYGDSLELALNYGKVTNQTFVDSIEFFLNNQQVFESIWSDIQDRSSGDVVRKEDDIELLDSEGFYKYIEDKYKNKVYDIEHIYIGGDGFNGCDVRFTDEMSLIIRFPNDTSKEKTITFYWDNGIKQSFFDELGKRFNIDDTGYRSMHIFPKEGKVSNNFFIEILEFIFKNMDNMLIESIWSDIQDRSSGDVVRKEDDVNHLCEDDFISYLKTKYTISNLSPYYSSSYENVRRNGYSITLFGDDHYPSISVYLDIRFNADKLQSIKINYHDPNKEFRNEVLPQLNDSFDVEDIDDRYNTYLIIKSKTGEINNKVVIDIIDFVIDILDNDKSIKVDYIIKKRVGN